MLLKIYIFVLVLVVSTKTVLCGFFTEYAPVDDDLLLQQGFTCQSANEYVGAMKEGEERLNYAPDVCGKVSCENGIVSYTTCGIQTLGKGCYFVPPPAPGGVYPDCCYIVRCS